MSIEMNTQIGGVGHGQTAGTHGADIQPIDPAQGASKSVSSAASTAPASAAAQSGSPSGPSVVDVINTPGTIAYQHMQNYLKTGDLGSYNFAYSAARMQLQQS